MNVTVLLQRWSLLPARTRAAAAGIASLALAASILTGIVTHPQQTSLFAAPLHPEQLAEVEERLAAWSVPFTPSADNVLVETKRRADLLLRLSMAGTPHVHVDGSGDILGKLGALTPQSVIDAQTRDGLAGDIELALRGIAGVQDARVIVAPAKPGYFADDVSRDATASIRLTMQPGMHLSAQAISGVRSFVAASVPGLDARNVTIVDDRGVALGDGSSDDDGADLQRSLQSALDAALGAGTAIVRVHIEYDRRSISSTDVRRAPLAALPVTSLTQSERFADAGKRYERSDAQVDRGSEERDVTASAPAGRIARITAAVMLDATHVSDIPQVKTLAAATLGIDPKRGDAVEVEAVNFARLPSARKDAWWLAYGAIVPLLPALVLAAAALAALRYAGPAAASFVQAYGERIALAHAAGEIRGAAPAGVRASLAGEPPHTAAAIISALPAATAAAVLELYPEHERSAIVARMHRQRSPLLDGMERMVVRG